MKINKILLILTLSFFGMSGMAQEVSVITPAEYQKEIKDNKVQLIDIRTPEEYKEGHIKGARNIDFFSDDFMREFETLDKTRPVYIYCRSGNRSSKASVRLSEAGFSEIIDLKGGWKAWSGYQEK